MLRLLADGHFVTILDNLSRSQYSIIENLRRLGQGRLGFYYVDLNNRAKLDLIFQLVTSARRVDYVIHFAAVAFVAESYANPILYYTNVTANTALLVETMTKYGINNLIYSSSCATYGNPKEMPITEDTPQVPVSPYGTSKLVAEKVIIDHINSHKQFGAILLRYFNVIGADAQARAGETPDLALPPSYHRISTACFLAASGRIPRLTITGTDHPTPDGTCVRDYVHVVDLVDAHIKSSAAIKPGVAGMFNVGVGRGYSVREFVAACKAATNVDITVTYGPKRAGDASLILADPSKIKAALKWEAQHTNLTDSLTSAYRWFKQHVEPHNPSTAKPAPSSGG